MKKYIVLLVFSILLFSSAGILDYPVALKNIEGCPNCFLVY